MTRHELPSGEWDDYDPAKGCCFGIVISVTMIAVLLWLVL